MKCPYRNFGECIGKECPACNYEVKEEEIIDGRYPWYMSTEDAIKNGMAWRTTKRTYEFVSCKLVDNNVQPQPVIKQEIKNTTRQNVVVNRSIF